MLKPAVALFTASIEKINTGIYKGNISKLNSIPPRKPIDNATAIEPIRLNIGVPSNSVINKAYNVADDNDRE